jgi:hypothetical protein
MTEAERVKAWRDRKRGGPPRPYVKRRLVPAKKRRPNLLKRARAIQAAWDDPLRRALMSKLKRRS